MTAKSSALAAEGWCAQLAVRALSGCWNAWRMISARERAPSLARMWETWVCTVLRDRNSSAAMSGLDLPSAIKEAILASVGVSASQPSVVRPR